MRSAILCVCVCYSHTVWISGLNLCAYVGMCEALSHHFLCVFVLVCNHSHLFYIYQPFFSETPEMKMAGA